MTCPKTCPLIVTRKAHALRDRIKARKAGHPARLERQQETLRVIGFAIALVLLAIFGPP